LEIALALVGDSLADYVFDGINRQRRVCRDGVGIVLHVALELRIGQHTIDQAHHLRLLRRKLPSGEEYFLGEGWADQIDKFLETVKAVAEAELRRQSAGLRTFRADPHVEAKSETDPTADAIAADHCNGWLGKGVKCIVGAIDR